MLIQILLVLIVFLRSVCRLLLTANVILISSILVTLIMEALLPSETSDLTRTTRRNTPEDGTLNECGTFWSLPA
jgi:hypothetical protein